MKLCGDKNEFFFRFLLFQRVKFVTYLRNAFFVASLIRPNVFRFFLAKSCFVIFVIVPDKIFFCGNFLCLFSYCVWMFFLLHVFFPQQVPEGNVTRLLSCHFPPPPLHRILFTYKLHEFFSNVQNRSSEQAK